MKLTHCRKINSVRCNISETTETMSIKFGIGLHSNLAVEINCDFEIWHKLNFHFLLKILLHTGRYINVSSKNTKMKTGD
jgi:hypothetical protein